ncbi:unnamed protein product, partial [Nesidiocoris tenuis]
MVRFDQMTKRGDRANGMLDVSESAEKYIIHDTLTTSENQNNHDRQGCLQKVKYLLADSNGSSPILLSNGSSLSTNRT